MNDLDWLARNVHEWKEGSESICKTYEFGESAAFDGRTTYQGVAQYTRAQWQARRDELSGKPSWGDIDGEWVFQDCHGWWHSFDETEVPHVQCVGLMDGKSCNYVTEKGFNGTYGKGKVLGDWRDTLERRPETEPACNEWTGPEDGLPPVGADVEYKVYDDTEWESGCVLAINGTWAWILEYRDMEPCTFNMTHTVFRPLRTEEDNAIEEMLSHDCDPRDGMLSREQFCRELYRSGYRKLNTPADSD